MAQLILKATANGNSGGINLYLSITRDDGTPVEGLTGENVAAKLVYGAMANQVVNVPTMDTHHFNLVEAQGLPGFYALLIEPRVFNAAVFPDGMPFGIQLNAKDGADVGQIVTGVEIRRIS